MVLLIQKHLGFLIYQNGSFIFNTLYFIQLAKRRYCIQQKIKGLRIDFKNIIIFFK